MKYVLIIEDTGNNYSGFSPDLPGCIATGSSVEQTLQEWKEAAMFHIEAMDEYPQPKSLKHWLAEGAIASDSLSQNFYITEVDVQLPVWGMVAEEG